MTEKHKHYDLILAWAEGKKIQVSVYNGLTMEWKDFSNSEVSPAWHPSNQYRIKPEPITVKYRRYIYTSTIDSTVQISTLNYGNPVVTEEFVKKMNQFIRWVDTEWQEETFEP